MPCTACSRGNLYQRHLVRFSGLYRIDYISFLLIPPCDFFIGRQIYLVDWYQFGTCQSFLTHVQGLSTAWMFASITSPVWKCSSYPDACFCLTEHQQTRSHCSLSVLINIWATKIHYAPYTSVHVGCRIAGPKLMDRGDWWDITLYHAHMTPHREQLSIKVQIYFRSS